VVTDSVLVKAAIVTNLIIAVTPRTPHCRGIFSKQICQFLAVAELRVSSESFSKPVVLYQLLATIQSQMGETKWQVKI